jgi:hypothetical protein
MNSGSVSKCCRRKDGLEDVEKVLTNSINAANKTSLPCSSKVHEVRGVYPREVAAAVRRVGAGRLRLKVPSRFSQNGVRAHERRGRVA